MGKIFGHGQTRSMPIKKKGGMGWHGQSRAMPIKKFGGMGIAHQAMGIKWAFVWYNFTYFLTLELHLNLGIYNLDL